MSEYVVGVDEVGRGSLVGSAIICAFRSQNSLFDKLPFSVSDSKKINKKKREEIYEKSTTNTLLFSFFIFNFILGHYRSNVDEYC